MNRREPINYHSSLFHSLMAYMLGLGFHSTLNWLYLQEIIHEDIFTYLWLAWFSPQMAQMSLLPIIVQTYHLQIKILILFISFSQLPSSFA